MSAAESTKCSPETVTQVPPCSDPLGGCALTTVKGRWKVKAEMRYEASGVARLSGTRKKSEPALMDRAGTAHVASSVDAFQRAGTVTSSKTQRSERASLA
jgi:hypothetical protein